MAYIRGALCRMVYILDYLILSSEDLNVKQNSIFALSQTYPAHTMPKFVSVNLSYL